MRVRTPFLAAAGVFALLLAGCTAPGPTAEVSSVTTVVQAVHGDDDPTIVAEPMKVEKGDTVTTDAAGLAEIAYADGSLTRLGPSTTLHVTELSTAEAQRSTVALDAGEIWNHVEKLTADKSTFEVATPVGVASVRGTAFAVECTAEPSCTITVMEGTVVFTLPDGTEISIGAYQRLIVPAPDGQTPEVQPITGDDVRAAAWLVENLVKDPDVAVPTDLAAAGLAGTWHVTFTVTANPFTFDDPERLPGIPAGGTLERDWTFPAGTCADTCTYAVTSSSGAAITLSGTPDALTFSSSSQSDCVSRDEATYGDIVEEDSATDTATYTVAVDDAAASGGVFEATSMTGTATVTRVPNPGKEACAGSPNHEGVVSATVKLTRVG